MKKKRRKKLMSLPEKEEKRTKEYTNDKIHQKISLDLKSKFYIFIHLSTLTSCGGRTAIYY